jgi:hypothetical protein
METIASRTARVWFFAKLSIPSPDSCSPGRDSAVTRDSKQFPPQDRNEGAISKDAAKTWKSRGASSLSENSRASAKRAGATITFLKWNRGMKPDATPTRDDVARLVRGKRSRTRVGSRHIRHRLRQDELQRLEIARSRGFLIVTQTTRDALRNAWHLDCRARLRACVFVERTDVDFVVTGEANSHPLRERLMTLGAVVSFVESL